MPQFIAAVGAWMAKHYVIAAIIKAAIVVGTYAYSRAQMKKALRGLNALDTGRTLTVREAAASRKIVYGRCRVGGVLVYIATSGASNEYVHMVIVHAGHECEAINDVYLNDVVVPLDGSGNATGTYAGYVRVKKHLGTAGQTADADLVSEMPGEWTTDHRLRGCCYTYWRLKHNPDLFPSGLPSASVDLDGKKLYDTRTATTYWAACGAMVWRDYMLDTELGLGADSSEINDTDWQESANVCEEAINLNPSGTENRYDINGVVDTATEPGAILEDILAAMAGSAPYIGGQFCLRAGAHTSSVKTITLDDARGSIELVAGDDIRDAANGVKGVFISEKSNWQPADFPPVVNSTYTTEDGGQRVWMDLTFPLTTSSATVQRLAKIALERSRQDFTIRFPGKLTLFNVRAGDVVALTIDRYGFAAKLFEVQEFEFIVENGQDGVPSLGIDLLLRETAAGVWDWSNGEETEVDLAPNTTLVSPTQVETPTGLTLTTANVRFGDGNIQPRLKVEWDTPTDVRITDGGYVEVDYKKTADTDWIVWNPHLRGAVVVDYILDVEMGVEYDVRIRFVNIRKVRGAFCSTVSHTVTDDVASTSDLVINPDFSLGAGSGWTIPGAPDWQIANGLGEFGGWGAAPLVASPFVLFNKQEFPVRSGERYVIRAKIKGTNIHARITFFDSSDTELSYADTPNAGSSWAFREGMRTAPLSAVWARAEVVGDATTDRVELVQVERLPSGLAYNEPATTVPPVQVDDDGAGTVTLLNDDPSATIKYTINGGVTNTYSGPFSVSPGDIVRSWGERVGYTQAPNSVYEVP